MESALAGFEGEAPSLAFVFASPRYELGTVLTAAAEVAPGMDVVGCTTAGEFTERGLTRHGVSVLLVRWGVARHELAPAIRMGNDSFELYRQICSGFRRMSTGYASEGLTSTLSVVLGDGLSSTLEQLVVQMRKLMRPGHQIVGAGAADDGTRQRTTVGQSARRAAAANTTVGQSARRAAAANTTVGQSARRAAAANTTVGQSARRAAAANTKSASPPEGRRPQTRASATGLERSMTPRSPFTCSPCGLGESAWRTA